MTLKTETGKIITFHSYKGGTGKSFLSLNTAAYLSKNKNMSVALFDFDFRAPTLIHKISPVETIGSMKYLNEYLEGETTINQVLYDCKTTLNSTTTFSIAYASPKTKDMQEMQMKTRQWQQKALTLLMKGLMTIKNDYDWIIIDSSPGVTYDSLNAMSSSDAVILVATPDRVDIAGTLEMSADIYPSIVKFGAQPALVLNKVPWTSNSHLDLISTDDLGKRFKKEVHIPIISKCPCICDTSLYETVVLVNEKPNHALIRNIIEIVDHMENLN